MGYGCPWHGQVDACGVCGGEAKLVDVRGACCSSGVVDARGACCVVSLPSLTSCLWVFLRGWDGYMQALWIGRASMLPSKLLWQSLFNEKGWALLTASAKYKEGALAASCTFYNLRGFLMYEK